MATSRKKTKEHVVDIAKATPNSSHSPSNKRLSPDDLPILLHDKEKQLIAGIKLDQAIFKGDELRLNGWCLGSPGLSLICDGIDVLAKITRTPRQDVLDAFSTTTDFDPGFTLTVKNASRDAYSLRWCLAVNGKTTPVDFSVDIDMQEAAEADPEKTTKRVVSIQTGADADAKKLRNEKIKYHIECALPVADGIALIGWVDDRFESSSEIYVFSPTGTSKAYPFKDNSRGARVIRTFRPDASQTLITHEQGSALLGFVVWLPIEAKPGTTLSVGFSNSFATVQAISISRLGGDTTTLAALQIHSGFALRSIAEQLIDSAVIALLDDFDAELFMRHGGGQLAAIDQPLVLNGKAILINGWIAAALNDIQKIEIIAGNTSIDIKSRLVHMVRPDLFETSKSHSLGFVALIDEPELLGFSTMKLRVRTRTAGTQVVQFSPGVADWPVLLSYMNAHHDLAEPIAKLIAASPAMQSLPSFNERMATLLRANFLSRYKSWPTSADNPANTIAAIDRVFALGEAGMLIFGWHYEPKVKPLTITVRGPEGQMCDVTENLFPLARLDVSQGSKSRFPEITDMCGFVCHAPLPTEAGESRAMCLGFGELGDVWLKLPTTATESHGVQLIKEILGVIPAPDKIRGSLYSLFDRALGPAIEAISAKDRKTVTDVSERQFGISPSAPTVSVIVPLYGRYDFLRHQLAHFVDDQDFDNVDLIYVVDDPSILAPALDMAAAHHQLFCQPFRIVWYGQNLGFAGANNIGVRVARADTLLLLNSDVIPQAPGWLTTLKAALEQLPNAGAVGPLLQFADNSVQHAGMHPKRDPFFPGFLLNIHPGKGLAWSKGDEPSQHPLLTAACLMLRKADYLAVGGFDEGYVIGDFEDSDLCQTLRKRGQSLWLVPAAKLWHLERQSQNLESIAGYRQLLTLFNGWRYHQKILNGEIANPELSEG